MSRPVAFEPEASHELEAAALWCEAQRSRVRRGSACDRRYDRARGALDRNPTYIVATYLAGATGAR